MPALMALFLDAARKASLALRWASVAAIVAVVQRDVEGSRRDWPL
jgi:hypothetical protein